jgi:hypothetical protein
MTEETPTLIDASLEPVTPPEAAPELAQRPAFELASGTLWSVTVAYRPQPEAAHTAAEFWVVTASPTGEEVYPIAIAKVRRDAPAAVELFVVSVARRGDVTGTVLRPRRAS